MMPAIQERQYPRQLIRPRLYVALNGSSSGGILNDVSEGGMSLDILGPKPAGEDVLLNFDLPEIGQHFEGKGKIAWSTQDGNENRVGLKFVDLSENSHWQIKKWLSHKASAAEALHNVVVQDWARDGGPASYSPNAPATNTQSTSRTEASPANVPLAAPKSGPPKQAQAPASKAPLPATGMNPPAGRTVKTTSSAAPVAARVAPPAPHVLEPKPVIAPAVVTIPQRASGSPTDDQLIAGLRSTFTQADLTGDGPIKEKKEKAEAPVKIGKEPVPFNREVFQSWVTGAIVVFVLIVATAAAKWIYTSPALDKVTSMDDVKKLVEEKLNLKTEPAPTTETTDDANPKTAKTGKVAHRDLKTVAHNGGAATRTENPGAPQFQVMDAQSGRTSLADKNAVPPPPAASTGAAGVSVAVGTAGTGATASALGGSKVGMVSVQPSKDVPVEKVIPEYPTLALEKNVQGRVVIRATIGKDGALQNVRLTGAPSLLSDAVVEAVRKWHYQPRLQNGAPVEVDTQITVDFEINAR